MYKLQCKTGLIISMALLLTTIIVGCGPVYDIRRSSLRSSATDADYGPKPTEKQLETERYRIFSYLFVTRGKDVKIDSFQKEQVSLEKDIIHSSYASPTPALVWVSTSQVSLKSPQGDYTEVLPFSFAWEKGQIIASRSPSESINGVQLRDWKYTK